MPISNLFSEYATLEAEIKALEAKQEQLKPHIIATMLEQGIDKEDVGIAKFSLSKRKKWSYPEPIIEMEEEVKAAKAKAESTGEATYEESDSLRCTLAKL